MMSTDKFEEVDGAVVTNMRKEYAHDLMERFDVEMIIGPDYTLRKDGDMEKTEVFFVQVYTGGDPIMFTAFSKDTAREQLRKKCSHIIDGWIAEWEFENRDMEEAESLKQEFYEDPLGQALEKLSPGANHIICKDIAYYE